ncbi:MAG: YkgJ family cysteine cluster protein [Dehalococcoidales bacterium]|nr:YkgJ family cysteine cluster protein [Dehalococcoidales bacterium]
MTAQAATVPYAGQSGEAAPSMMDCFRCGLCCENRRVQLSLAEARHICECLGLNWYLFMSTYLESTGADDRFLLRQRDGRCVFLKDTDVPQVKVCIIHHFKPASCRLWNASPFRRDCREGLERYWGISVDGEGRLVGEPEKVQRFNRFLEAHLRRRL